jgi:hypothetical protein
LSDPAMPRWNPVVAFDSSWMTNTSPTLALILVLVMV